jgi:hypothetical protein
MNYCMTVGVRHSGARSRMRNSYVILGKFRPLAVVLAPSALVYSGNMTTGSNKADTSNFADRRWACEAPLDT